MWGCARNRCRCAGAGREWSEDSRAVGRRQSAVRWHRSSTRYRYPQRAGYAGGPASAGGTHRVEAYRLDPFPCQPRGSSPGFDLVERNRGLVAVFGSLVRRHRTKSPRSVVVFADVERRAPDTVLLPDIAGFVRLHRTRALRTSLGALLRKTCALDRGKLGCAANEVRAVVKHDPAFAAPIPVVPAFDPARLSRRSRRNEQVGA